MPWRHLWKIAFYQPYRWYRWCQNMSQCACREFFGSLPRATGQKRLLLNDGINDREDSCARLVIRRLQNAVQWSRHKHLDFLVDQLLRFAGDLCCNYRFDFVGAPDHIVFLWFPFCHFMVSACSIFGRIGSSWSPSLFRRSAHALASSLLSLTFVCAVRNDVSCISIFFSSVDSGSSSRDMSAGLELVERLSRCYLMRKTWSV